MMVQDRFLYDPTAHRYTVDVATSMTRSNATAGIDAVLVWPIYPNMGIDNRRMT